VVLVHGSGPATRDGNGPLIEPFLSQGIAVLLYDKRGTGQSGGGYRGVGPLRVELRTNGLCWVALSVDGEPVLARLLRAGEHLVFEVEAEAEMRVGDPGALSVTINGRPGRSLGESEEPVDVRITRTNFRQYLAGQ
jgi:hypothetical protein